MMDEEMIKEIKQSLTAEQADSDFVVIRGVKHEPVQLSKDGFHQITPADSSKRILFIDGGNQEVLKTPHVSLQFIRLYYTIYQNNKRIDNKKTEFYALVKLKTDQSKEQIAQVRIFGSDIIPSTEFNLKEFDSEVNLSKIGSLVRRLAEIKTAELACDNTDIIVLDGTLFAPTKAEQEYINTLRSSASQNNVLITALSKTSHLVTDSGQAVASAVARIKPEAGCWYYHPLAEIKDPRYCAELYLAMLDPKAAHIFLIELQKSDHPTNAAELFSILRMNSTDPVFRGYPYGLIEADRFARVSDKEKGQLRMILMAKAGESWKPILEAENPLNAHSVLDNIL
ncbi:DNA double-strand break repair nuclease NurA [Thermoproteota archaeon]